jgi:hypothetical protein
MTRENPDEPIRDAEIQSFESKLNAFAATLAPKDRALLDLIIPRGWSLRASDVVAFSAGSSAGPAHGGTLGALVSKAVAFKAIRPKSMTGLWPWPLAGGR